MVRGSLYEEPVVEESLFKEPLAEIHMAKEFGQGMVTHDLVAEQLHGSWRWLHATNWSSNFSGRRGGFSPPSGRSTRVAKLAIPGCDPTN